MPKIDIGRLLSRSPFQISVNVPDTILMLTELAPPPKNLVTISVAKFGAVAEGINQMRNMI
jgi:hypothetical protein